MGYESKSGAISVSPFFVVASDADDKSKAVADFICNGTADDVQIQAAIDALPVFGGTVELSEGTFAIASQILNETNNVTLKGQGRATVLEQNADVIVLRVLGVASASESTVDSNASAGDTTIVLAADEGANFAVDNWILVLSDEEWASGRSKIGEIQRITSISTDTLTVESPLRDAYTTANSAAVKLLTPNEGFHISNLRITNANTSTNTATFLSFVVTHGLRADNLWLDKASSASGIEFNTSWDWSADSIYCEDFTDAGSNEYGLEVHGATEHGLISNMVGRKVRHTFTSTKATDVGSKGIDHGVPRNITLTNVHARENHSSGLDTHEDGEEYYFTNCQSVGAGGSGFNSRAGNVHYVNCQSTRDTTNGFRASVGNDVFIVGGSINTTSAGLFAGSGVTVYATALEFNGVSDPTDGAGTFVLRNCIGSTLDGLIPDPGDGNAITASLSGHVPLVSAGAETRTIADAAEAGLTLDLYFKTDSGDCVVTSASPVNQTGNNTMTFADVGDHLRLASIEDGADFEWRVVANDGVALSTV